MLRLTIDFLDAKDRKRRIQRLYEIDIWNTADHPESPKMGNYKCRILSSLQIPRVVRFKDHDRTTGLWPIIKRLAAHLEKR